MDQNRCYQPTHNLDISNPPQGGSGYPSKTNLEHAVGLITHKECGIIINKISSVQIDIIRLTVAVGNITDGLIALEKRIEALEKLYNTGK